MKELDDVLANATASIEELYFRLPIDGGEATLYERNYCYELYHQMRCAWPVDCAFSLNGEIDKRRHPIIGAFEGAQAIPDLLVHTPGSMDGNHAIIEVKRARASAAGIRKDLATLSRFLEPDIHYQRGIYLFFGAVDMGLLHRVAQDAQPHPNIEIWLHRHVGEAARRIEPSPIGD